MRLHEGGLVPGLVVLSLRRPLRGRALLVHKPETVTLTLTRTLTLTHTLTLTLTLTQMLVLFGCVFIQLLMRGIALAIFYRSTSQVR